MLIGYTVPLIYWLKILSLLMVISLHALSFPWAGVQPSLGEQGSIMCKDLGRRMPSVQFPPLPSSPTLYTEHGVTCYGISLCSAKVSCPSSVPSQLLGHPQPPPWWGTLRSRKVFDSVQVLFYFQHQYKT